MVQKDFVELRASLKLTITNLGVENWDKVRTTFQALLSSPRAIKSVSNNDSIVCRIDPRRTLTGLLFELIEFHRCTGLGICKWRLAVSGGMGKGLTFFRKPKEATFSSAPMKRR